LRVVADQRGTPTPADDLAWAIARIAALIECGRGVWGTFHFAGNETVSWFQFAEAIVERSAASRSRCPRVVPITTAEFPTSARRPSNSALDSSRIGSTYGIPPADWRRGLDRLIDKLTVPMA